MDLVRQARDAILEPSDEQQCLQATPFTVVAFLTRAVGGESPPAASRFRGPAGSARALVRSVDSQGLWVELASQTGPLQAEHGFPVSGPGHYRQRKCQMGLRNLEHLIETSPQIQDARRALCD